MKSLRKLTKVHYFRKTIVYLLIYCLILNTSLPVVLAVDPPAARKARRGTD